MISAKIVADSVSPVGNRITTFVATYPRFIHSEVMTHRSFSRNAASSRAIPVKKMVDAIKENPAMPVFWGKNQKGMQAAEELDDAGKAIAQVTWLQARDAAVQFAEQMLDNDVHKQIANRLLEPFAHMTTLITATDYANFFNLRAHPDAQPEFQELAYVMLEAYVDSVPQKLKQDEWHLPFADQYIESGLTPEQLLKISTARAARVSYLNFEGNIDHEKDYALHDSLLANGHMSPFEHAAQATTSNKYFGNFKGWLQYRKLIPDENKLIFNPAAAFHNREMRRKN